MHDDTRGMPVELTQEEAGRLAALQRSGDVDARSARRARILELLGQGRLQKEVVDATGAGIATVGRVRRRYLEEGFEAAVFGFVPPGKPRRITEREEASIVALACSDPPDGRARWTTALLAEESVSRGLVDEVGRETVRVVLKRHGIKPWREKNVVRERVER